VARHGGIIAGAANSGRYEVRIASGDVQPGEGVAFLSAQLDGACPAGAARSSSVPVTSLGLV
jgi:hypothetical protein